MRILISLLFVASICLCCGQNSEVLLDGIKLGAARKGVFVSTNDTAMRFYLIAKEIEFSSLVGTKLNKESLDLSRILSTKQYVPSQRFENGGTISKGYNYVSGRYGVLSGNVLTLTDFRLVISDDEASPGEVLSVRWGSVSLKVGTEFKKEAEEKMLEQQNPK